MTWGWTGGSPQNVNELDTSGMSPYQVDASGGNAPFPITMGESKQLLLPGKDPQHPQVFTIAFPGLRQYSLFMVKKDDGVPLVYATFLAIMTGLMVKLYLKPALDRRRRGRGPLKLPPISTTTELPPPVAADLDPEPERETVGV